VAWAMASDTYIGNMLNTVKELLKEKGKELRTTQRCGQTPLPVTYKPELDVTRELEAAEISEYLQLIGMLRWAVELGRIDIALETAFLLQYSASPRERHMEAVYYIFAYFTLFHRVAKLVFDPSMPMLDESCFQHDVNWKPFYGDLKEECPMDHPTLLRNRIQLKQVLACNLIATLRIKLHYFGIPLTGAANMLCDKQGVVKNSSIPESTLTKKHNAINYHMI
jgi:hypothetical protein